MTRTLRLLPLLLPILLLFTSCDQLPGVGSGDTALPPVAGVPTPSVVPIATANVTPPTVPAAPLSPLRLWVPPEIGARTASGTEELANQVRAFESTQRDLDVIVEQEPFDGSGGILSYLRTGRQVAPSMLPDVIALPTSALADPSVREMVFPFGGLIDPAFLSDIYPAPAGQVVSDDRLYGYPFATFGLSHLAYRPSVVTDTVSMNWSTFISDTGHTLVLPADSRDGALFGLQFYLAEGGAVINDTGQPDLQVEPLTRALEQIAIGKTGLLQSRQMKTLDEAWQYHQLGLSDFVWTRSDYLLGEQAGRPEGSSPVDEAYSRIPGPSGPLTPLTATWAWAITASDPVRQELAAELIASLTTPEAMAAWAERAQVLPARREAMSLLAEGNRYHRFAGGELERAQALPLSESSRLLDVLGDAVFQVLTTETPPAAIAEATVAALRQ